MAISWRAVGRKPTKKKRPTEFRDHAFGHEISLNCLHVLGETPVGVRLMVCHEQDHAEDIIHPLGVTNLLVEEGVCTPCKGAISSNNIASAIKGRIATPIIKQQ